ncbi:hypothetical protein [Xanthomonas pisi]|uniref:Uncharacterized protein n=2 Tax=Xanthomonas pisi TaxID=56457 RepID=A0A2S7D0Z2_9XANT|nr:hypothetical protein [Xanthomonas pisi]KLD69629.1 hypothetical protein Y887_16110 [Xanthomonas pisi DSM 18956]PPU67515.1 hypothetical protein XpiCFBP4643_14845 [Xanthomonas pisi]
MLLSIALDEHAQLAKKTLRSDVKRFVCWGDVSHLRTGRNGCNADGTKVTAMTATSSQTSQASMLVSACTTTVKVYTDPESRGNRGVARGWQQLALHMRSVA